MICLVCQHLVPSYIISDHPTLRDAAVSAQVAVHVFCITLGARVAYRLEPVTAALYIMCNYYEVMMFLQRSEWYDHIHPR
jgi:hypothetical protein